MEVKSKEKQSSGSSNAKAMMSSVPPARVEERIGTTDRSSVTASAAGDQPLSIIKGEPSTSSSTPSSLSKSSSIDEAPKESEVDKPTSPVTKAPKKKRSSKVSKKKAPSKK